MSTKGGLVMGCLDVLGECRKADKRYRGCSAGKIQTSCFLAGRMCRLK